MRSSRKAPLGVLLALSVLSLSPTTLQAKGGPCDPLTGFCQYICGLDTLFLNFDANPGHVSYDIFIDGVQFFDDELVTAPVTQMMIVDPPEGVVNIEIVTTCGDGSTMTNNCIFAIAPPVAPPGTDLIIVKEGVTTGDRGFVDSTAALESSLIELGREPVRRAYGDFTNFVNEGCLDLMEWDVVWVMGGTLPNGALLSTSEGDLLAARVAAGLPTYFESPQHWLQAPPSDLDLVDGVDQVSQGAVVNQAAPIDLSFPLLMGSAIYAGEITPTLTLPITIDPLAENYVSFPPFQLGVFSAPMYSTPLEFGGFPPADHTPLAHAILERFGEAECSVITNIAALPSTPETLITWESVVGDSQLEFSFDPPIVNAPGPVASFEESVVIPTIDLTPMGESFMNLMPGETYQVTIEQTCATPGMTPDPIQLTLEIPCYSSLGGGAELVPGGVELFADGSPETYAAVRFLENGVVVATLPPGADSVVIQTTAGPHDYQLEFSCDGIEFIEAPGAFIFVPCEPISNLLCTNGPGSNVDLTWTNGVIYSEIQIVRNGSLIATLPGTDSTFSDPSAPAGSNTYVVSGICDGMPSAGMMCTLDVGTEYIRGDCNVDSATDVGDAVAALAVLFTGGTTSCQDACNVNGDAAVDIADAIYLLSYLFSGGAEPPAPFPECGIADQLGCDAGPSCVSTQ